MYTDGNKSECLKIYRLPGDAQYNDTLAKLTKIRGLTPFEPFTPPPLFAVTQDHLPASSASFCCNLKTFFLVSTCGRPRSVLRASRSLEVRGAFFVYSSPPISDVQQPDERVRPQEATYLIASALYQPNKGHSLRSREEPFVRLLIYLLGPAPGRTAWVIYPHDPGKIPQDW